MPRIGGFERTDEKVGRPIVHVGGCCSGCSWVRMTHRAVWSQFPHSNGPGTYPHLSYQICFTPRRFS